jgi:hypothetical protein
MLLFSGCRASGGGATELYVMWPLESTNNDRYVMSFGMLERISVTIMLKAVELR